MGFIYLLYNAAGNGYIGQTKLSMKRRLRVHYADSNSCSSKRLGEFEWLVLEEVANEDLLDFERYYYDMYSELFPGMLVNRCKPLNTRIEYETLNKLKIKEQLKNSNKIYREANIELIKEKCKINYEANKDKILARNRAYKEKVKLAKSSYKK